MARRRLALGRSKPQQVIPCLVDCQPRAYNDFRTCYGNVALPPVYRNSSLPDVLVVLVDTILSLRPFRPPVCVFDVRKHRNFAPNIMDDSSSDNRSNSQLFHEDIENRGEERRSRLLSRLRRVTLLLPSRKGHRLSDLIKTTACLMTAM